VFRVPITAITYISFPIADKAVTAASTTTPVTAAEASFKCLKAVTPGGDPKTNKNSHPNTQSLTDGGKNLKWRRDVIMTSSSVSIVTAISSIGFDVVSVNLVLPFFSRASDLYTCTRVVQLFIRLLRYSWPHDHVTSSETLPRDKVAILASLQFFVVFIWLFYLLYPFWIYFWVCAIYLYYLCLFFKNWYILIFIIEKYGLKKITWL